MGQPRRLVLFATCLGILLVPQGGGAAGDGLGTPAKQGTAAAQSPSHLFGFGRQEIGIAVGHGLGIPIGKGNEELEDVQFIYVAPRWGIGISDPMGGDAWYRGNFELLGEGALLFNFEPKDGFAGGITAMLRYNFLSGGNFIPFVEAGAGILFLDIDLENQADGLNFTPQGGVGFHYFVSEWTAVTGEWRLHHISNGDINGPNKAINDSLFLIGISTFFQ